MYVEYCSVIKLHCVEKKYAAGTKKTCNNNSPAARPFHSSSAAAAGVGTGEHHVVEPLAQSAPGGFARAAAAPDDPGRQLCGRAAAVEAEDVRGAHVDDAEGNHLPERKKYILFDLL